MIFGIVSTTRGENKKLHVEFSSLLLISGDLSVIKKLRKYASKMIADLFALKMSLYCNFAAEVSLDNKLLELSLHQLKLNYSLRVI